MKAGKKSRCRRGRVIKHRRGTQRFKKNQALAAVSNFDMQVPLQHSLPLGLLYRPVTPPPAASGGIVYASSSPPLIIDQAMRRPVAEVERMLGYQFADPTLLVEALTHSSHPSRPSYQRLEFVGDAALNLAFTNYLFRKNPHLDPGHLSSLRAANVSTEKFARVAVHHGLYRLLRRNSAPLDQMVEEFTRSVMREERAAFSFGGSTVKAPKVLADIVESIAAAVYVDANYDLGLLWKVFKKLLQPIVTSQETLDEQPVAMVHELCQKLRKSIEFRDHIKRNKHTVKAIVDGVVIATRTSEQKAMAKLNVARDVLTMLSVDDDDQAATASPRDHIIFKQEEDEVSRQLGAKQELHDLCGKNHWGAPVYKLEKEQGPAHAKRFTVSVRVQTPDMAFVTVSGMKPKVRDAENAAASDMLLKLLEINCC